MFVSQFGVLFKLPINGRISQKLVSLTKPSFCRLINTKQPTSSTAAAPKVQEDFEDEDPQQSPRRWQANTTKIQVPVDNQSEEVLYTCETIEERDQRLRTSAVPAEHPTTMNSMPTHEWKSFFHLFTRTEGMSMENVQLMRTVIGGDIDGLKQLNNNRKWLNEVEDQKLRTERLLMLGPDLAAAHFIVFRGGRVKFHNNNKWFKMNEADEYDLPNLLVPGMHLQEIDASNVKLLYEGLENLMGCDHLEHINVSGSQIVDNWFIDRICHQHHTSLVSLNISNCHLLTLGAITALARLPKLRSLNVDGLNIQHLQLACLSLEEELPGLQVTGIDIDFQNYNITDEEITAVYDELKPSQR